MLTKKQWYNEYKEDLILLYKKIMYVLKTRNLLYKDYYVISNNYEHRF